MNPLINFANAHTPHLPHAPHVTQHCKLLRGALRTRLVLVLRHIADGPLLFLMRILTRAQCADVINSSWSKMVILGLVFAGAVVGMTMMGYLGDILGRKRAYWPVNNARWSTMPILKMLELVVSERLHSLSSHADVLTC